MNLIFAFSVLVVLLLFIVFCIHMLVLTTHAQRKETKPPHKYVTRCNIIKRADEKPLTDTDVEYLRKTSYERTMKIEQEYLAGQHNIFRDNAFSEDEMRFFTEFVTALRLYELIPERIKLERLSNKTFNVTYVPVCYVGKIKLVGQKHYMQYLIGEDTVKALDNPTVESCIRNIPKWIRYIKYCQKP
jgi:hypothetical protein